MRQAKIIALLCFPLLAQEPVKPAEGPVADYTILYTGRTLGYYRVPDQQTTQSRICSDADASLVQVNRFLRAVRSVEGPKVVVGMGDNFSPELNARMMLDAATQQLVPRDRLVWDFNTSEWVGYAKISGELNSALTAGGGTVGFDNVACFFRLAGFDAIVPGREDFHFGPQRLRELARYLASTRSGGKPVQMLGANLAIRTFVVNPASGAAAPTKGPVNYSLSGQNGSSFRLPAVPLPWLRRFDILNGRPDKASPLYRFAWLCARPQASEFDPQGCESLERSDIAPAGSTLSFSLRSGFPRYPQTGSLRANEDYFVCASINDNAAEMTARNTLCSPAFRFHYPLLQYGNSTDSNPKPYARIAGQPLVVFGVVDPTLLPRIGQMNYSWINRDSNLDTQVEISDPREGLMQMLQTCDADPECRGMRKILLAQMPPEDARRLADRLRGQFEAIISAVEDAHATANTLVVDRNIPLDRRPPAVLTPASHFFGNEPEQLQVTLQEAKLNLTATARSVDNRLNRVAVPLKLRTYTGQQSLADVLAKAGVLPKAGTTGASASAQLENTVLSIMRKRCGADIAFFQHRDLFRPEYFSRKQPAAGELQTMLDELLWKGDFLVCRAATGSVIRQVLAQSDAFDASQNQESVEGSENGRGLARLGIFRDSSTGELIVGGAVLQDGRLYSIATTDYIGPGDTGYDALRQIPVAPSARLRDFSNLDEISALVCREVIRGVQDSGQTGACRQTIDTSDYFDQTELRPYVQPIDAGAVARLREWLRQNWANRSKVALPADPVESAAQNRRVLSLRLDRANIGFQQNLHSLSESQQRQRFSGVQPSQPTAPERIDATADWLLRLTSRGKNVDLFVQTDATYQATAIRQVFTGTSSQTGAPGTSTEPFQLSQARNTVAAEGGATWHLIPLHQKSATGLRLLTSARFETELASPFVQFQASDGFVSRLLPRRNSLFGKAGIRYDGRQSWLETGIQSGPFTQISSLTLGGLTCTPGSITACVAPPGAPLPSVSDLDTRALTAHTVRRNQSGVFLNARIHLPLLLHRFDYTIDNAGALYFNLSGDSPADTRYLEVMTHAITIPVVGNLSIAPRVDLFFFQNKVAGWHIHGYQTSITAQYRFDWHTGLRFRSALRYPNPPPAANQ